MAGLPTVDETASPRTSEFEDPFGPDELRRGRRFQRREAELEPGPVRTSALAIHPGGVDLAPGRPGRHASSAMMGSAQAISVPPRPPSVTCPSTSANSPKYWLQADWPLTFEPSTTSVTGRVGQRGPSGWPSTVQR